MRELSIVELSAESAVVLPSRSLLRHHRRGNTVTQQMNNTALSNATGVGARALALNVSALNTQNVQKFVL